MKHQKELQLDYYNLKSVAGLELLTKAVIQAQEDTEFIYTKLVIY